MITVVDDGGGISSNRDSSTKKVRFKGMDVDMNREAVSNSSGEVAIDPSLTPVMYWKDKVVGSGSSVRVRDEDLEFLDGDITKSTANGISMITFFPKGFKIFWCERWRTLLW
ncbi:hypothetical protein V6Z11_D05G317500 [Gossypium hirsutum]